MSDFFSNEYHFNNYFQDNEMISSQIGNTLVSIMAINVLLEEIRSSDLSNIYFVKNANTELKEVLKQNNRVSNLIRSFLKSNPGHPAIFSIKKITAKVTQQVKNIQSTLNRAALDAIDDVNIGRMQQHRIQLETEIYQLCASLNRLNTHLKQLDRTDIDTY